MKRPGYKPSRMLILLLALAVLLPLLAALQYYWLGQVSEGASERMRTALRANAADFRHDFNREFIRAYLTFHMDEFESWSQAERNQVEQLELWQQSAPYARLISDVLVVSYDKQTQAQLKRVDLNSKSLVACEWPNELSRLRAAFARTGQVRGVASPQAMLESYAEDIPALIVPFPLDTARTQGPPIHPGFTIIKLDLNYIRNEFIPLLVKRHLADDSKTAYEVSVVSLEDPNRVIYSSVPARFDASASDVSTRIFGLEADELRSFISESSRPAERAGRPLKLFSLRTLKAPSANSTTANDEEGRWQLLVRHPAGSLAAAVSRVRYRNLAISFGVLLLLGAALLMTAISTRRAESLAQQQLNFVAGVSHELRTPLAVICSAGQNLSHGIVDDPNKVAEYGEVIYREGRRLTNMVERVLEYAGAGSGRQVYDFRAVDVQQLLESAIAGCETEIAERCFTIEMDVEQRVPQIRGDSAALRRAMQNLISNAIKYDGEKQWARISARAKLGQVEISVADRGRGIPASDIPHIFEPFYRGRDAVAAQIEGSGIGLSLVKQIIDAHSGEIDVKSTPGLGSEFILRLPVAHAANAGDRES
jgi:signal transduction histidine kinase